MKLRHRFTLTRLTFLVISAFLMGCAGVVPKPSQVNFIPPVVTLDSVEVVHYWGWWYFSDDVKPTLGKAGNYGAPLDLAFTFNIENPNPYPVMMEDLRFTIAFEAFDLNTVSAATTQWIPAGKSKKWIGGRWIPTGKVNQVRVQAMFDGRQSMLNLRQTGGFKLQEKGMGAGTEGAFKQLEAWWKGVPDFAFPIHVKEGAAIFRANGLTQVSTFRATFP